MPLPTRGVQERRRSVDGEDILLEYGNGPLFLVEGGTVMRGEGTATHLGPFTTYAEFCHDWTAGEGNLRIHHGVTPSGTTFEWICDGLVPDVPVFVPGLNRAPVPSEAMNP